MTPPRVHDSDVAEQVHEFLKDYGDRPEFRALGLILQDVHALMRDGIATNKSVADALLQNARQWEAFQKRFTEHEAMEFSNAAARSKETAEMIASIQANFGSQIAQIIARLDKEKLDDTYQAGVDAERERGKAKGERNAKIIFGIVQSVVGSALALFAFFWNQHTSEFAEVAKSVRAIELTIAKQSGRNGP